MASTGAVAGAVVGAVGIPVAESIKSSFRQGQEVENENNTKGPAGSLSNWWRRIQKSFASRLSTMKSTDARRVCCHQSTARCLILTIMSCWPTVFGSRCARRWQRFASNNTISTTSSDIG
ncbi:hypothetical protein JG687_00011253 [Phytophthora cactorum]|uniref:Uncharacterized protein n=1 Tax=Phytophthora cactorum TaxID=29920 RepID=A0A8T1U9M9_9STRA|nr:hypothetical protein JG687_00011253 [Phytophthora cactorum]